MNVRGRTLFEALLVVITGAILLIIAINVFLGHGRIARENALRYELTNIRTAVTLHAIKKKRYPESLQALMSARYLLPPGTDQAISAKGNVSYEDKRFISRAYLETAAVDSKGNPLDPFGNPYRYDRSSGRVQSSTGGYENW